MTRIALTLFILLACSSVAAVRCDVCASVVGLFTTFHARDWSTLNPESISVLVPFKLIQREERYPKDSGYDRPCSGSLYLLSEQPTWHLSIEFDRDNRNERCTLILNSIAFESRLSNAAAIQMAGEVANSLKATGVQASAQKWQYQWRSRDSRTRFDLFESVVSKKNATPDTPATLKIILRQESVSPVDVDDLPFEKGFVCPSSEASPQGLTAHGSPR